MKGRPISEVSYDKSADDLIGTYRDYFATTVRKRGTRQAILFAVLGAVIVAAGSRSDLTGTAGAAWVGAGVGLVLALPTCWAVSWLLLPRRARRLYDQQRTRDVHWTWRWSEAGLESETATGSNRYGWRELHGWHDGKRTLQFFLNEAHFLYIPRHRLSPAQADELRDLAEAAGVPRR